MGNAAFVTGRSRAVAPARFLFRSGGPALLALCLAVSPLQAARIEGVASLHGDLAAGVTIYASRRPEYVAPAAGAAALSVSTDAAGAYALNLAPGRWYLTALKKGAGRKASPEAGDLYCFFSGNPVETREGAPAEVAFNLVRIPADGQIRAGATGLEGQMRFAGRPLDHAYLYVYQNADDGFRGLGILSAPVGADGRFSVRLAPGRYWIIGRKRRAGGMTGPLRKDDQVGYYHGNPVTIREGETTSVVIEAIARLEQLEEKTGARKPQAPFVVSGTIRDPSGRPQAGMVVLGYADPAGTGTPRALSAPSGVDGRYRLEPRGAGTYYLVARENLGGPPEPGERVARPLGEGAKARSVKVDERNPALTIDFVVGSAPP